MGPRWSGPRLAGLGLASAAAVVFLGGCSADGGTTTPGAEASASTGVPTSSASAGAADPAATSALADAAAKLGTTSFKMTMTSGSGLKVDGLLDAPNGVGTATLTASGPNTEITVKTLIVDKDLYVQVPGVTKANTWTHVDVSRLPEGANIGLRPGQIDPANTAQLLTATTDVRQTGSRGYAGTLDLTKAAGVAGMDQKTVQAWGDQGAQRSLHRGHRRPGPAVDPDHPAPRGERQAAAAARHRLHRLRHQGRRPAPRRRRDHRGAGQPVHQPRRLTPLSRH
ncbi:hypothetical protein L083_7174 [Actinoplanes sp. N902-109]|nr:hypothetical protein L083_7174 [Actinoplanes sp. N902-109]